MTHKRAVLNYFAIERETLAVSREVHENKFCWSRIENLQLNSLVGGEVSGIPQVSECLVQKSQTKAQRLYSHWTVTFPELYCRRLSFVTIPVINRKFSDYRRAKVFIVITESSYHAVSQDRHEIYFRTNTFGDKTRLWGVIKGNSPRPRRKQQIQWSVYRIRPAIVLRLAQCLQHLLICAADQSNGRHW